MRTSTLRLAPIAAGACALLATAAAHAAPAAQATPTQVNVRIEGKSETLFEGPILTEGHEIEASSDTQQRPCDGINPNDPENTTPGPTPTAASVDAMSLLGETFDGRWYGGYDDYFITRWGPDREEQGMSWGVLVNNVFTDVGGCQYELRAGDEVLWAYNAFASKPFLALLPVAAGYTSGTRPLTATAELSKPFEVEVLDYSDDKEDVPPATSERTGSAPYADADVSPVQTSVKGFEKVETTNPETVTTEADGRVSITFTTPGWHRIKATAVNAGGEESAIRSNRLDVCVPEAGASGCGEPPAEDQVRIPPYTAEEAKREEEAKRKEKEGRPSPEPEGKPEVPPTTTTPSVLVTTPFSGGVSPGPSPSTPKKPTIAKGHSQARCVHAHERRTPSHRRVRRKCKITVTPRPKPKRHPRLRRRGR
jgi:hypothetical protein